MARKQILLDTQISLDTPGTILRDFNTVLEFIGTDGIETSGKFHLIPMKRLGELNGRLCHPIRIALKRPIQKSYPSIQGLYLLLRGSGLATLVQKGKKIFLTVDAESREAWRDLNPSEQYFTLLETWLFAMDSSLVESGRGQIQDNTLVHLQTIYGRFGKRTRNLHDDPDSLRISSQLAGLHNLALMHLFGVLNIQDAEPEPGEGWNIRTLNATPFGDALYWRLNQADITRTIVGIDGPDSGAEQRKWFMTKFRPLFPELQNHLELPETNRTPGGSYTFRVTLPRCCEGRLQLSGKMRMEALSEGILDMVAFDRDHLYSFYYRNRRSQRCEVSHPYMKDSVSTTEVALDALGLVEGQELTYVYDFGDHWEFHITVERIEDGGTEATGEAILLEFTGKKPSQYGGGFDDEDWEEDE